MRIFCSPLLFLARPLALAQPHRPLARRPTTQLFCWLVLLLAASFGAQAQQLFNTDLVMREIRHPHGDLVQICAHRGIFTPGGVPENSLQAISQTAKAHIELVELDIKVTKNGVPILMHDPGVGRTTNFDARLAKTALVSNLYWAKPRIIYPKGFVLNGIKLRHNISRNSPRPVLGSVSANFLPSLENALQFIQKQKISIVVVLDLKDINALKACLPIVSRYKNGFGNPFLNSVIFKFDGRDFPNGNAYNQVKAATGKHDFNFMLRFNTTSILDKTQPRVIYAAHRGNAHFMGIEAVSKAIPLALDNVIRAALIDNHAVWNYYPLPELSGKRYFWFGPNSPLRDGTYRSQNTIDNDNAAFARASFAIREDRDHREDNRPDDGTAIRFLLDQAHASGLTYDNPVALAGKLNRRNERNVARYLSGFTQKIASTAPAIVLPDGVYTLTNSAAAGQLTLGKVSVGMAVASPEPAPPQHWQLQTNGGNGFTLASQQTGQRLALVGATLTLTQANDQDSTQLWTAQAGPDGYVSLLSAQAQQPLATDAAGTALALPADSEPTSAQLWRLTLVSVPAVAVVARPAAAPAKAPAASADPLLEIFPNPANGSFTVRWQSPQSGAAHLILRSLTGEVLAERDAVLEAGINELNWDTSRLAPGVYVLSLTTGTQQVVKNVLVAR